MYKDEKIPFIKPHFPSAELVAQDYAAIIESNWFTNFGPYEQRLCQEVAKFVGQGVSVTTTANATLGIDLAMRAFFGRHNDGKNEIIVPSFTFIAGPAMIIDHGFVPVLIDINDALQPDYDQAKAYLERNDEKVAGILLCNIFGVGNQAVKDWEMLAKEYGIPLIIDSAAGFGSKYTDLYIGARGDCEIFSMHATKPFSVGEGG